MGVQECTVWRWERFAYLESLWPRLAYHQSPIKLAAHHDHLACEWGKGIACMS